MSKFNSKSFNPQAFGAYIKKIPDSKKNELISSRAIKVSRDIYNVFKNQTGAFYARLPMYGNLSGEALNYDGETDITAETTNTFERGVIVVGRAKAWTERDFSEDITGGGGFMSAVARQVAQFWAGIDQDILLSILKGIFDMETANEADFVEKHTFDITKETNPLMGADTLNNAVQKACGDNKGKFKIAIMHSAVATNLENLQLLKYWTQTDDKGIQRSLTLASLNGRVVLIDDSMPVTAGSDGKNIYTTYILGEGAFEYADIGAKVPYEMNRDPKTNGGEDTLYTRQRKVFAPFGLSYEKIEQGSLSPTNEELENGANWVLANDGTNPVNHKIIPIARIISKG